MHNAYVVYKFTCPCSSTYIGETYRLLDSRILEHRRDTPSHICLHIKNCSHYKSSLTQLYGDQPSDPQKREFFKPLFTIIERNISNNYARKIFEGMMITLDRPDLNKQVYHHSTALICKCVLPSVKNFPGS